MGFWLTVLAMVVVVSLVVRRLGRRRRTWQSTSIGEISRDSNVNYGNIQIQSSQQSQHHSGGGNF